MIKTFNCGVGFCLVIKSNNFNKVIKNFKGKYKPYLIGKIISGKKRVKFVNKIKWN
tara:strand:- start:377 stop:544 length:168 start_codon:yes stop_codon:yes gene_type:complete